MSAGIKVASVGANQSSNSINTIGLGGYTLAGQGVSMTGHDELTQMNNQGLNIRIVPATGGTIISIRADNNYSNGDLFVIHEDQDLGAELGKIITLHYLKK